MNPLTNICYFCLVFPLVVFIVDGNDKKTVGKIKPWFLQAVEMRLYRHFFARLKKYPQSGNLKI